MDPTMVGLTASRLISEQVGPLELQPREGTVPPCSTVGSSNESPLVIDLKLLNCPNCVKPWSNNTLIMQCVNGHSICNSCYVRLDKCCPSCSNPLVVRNLALEALFKKMVLQSHCKNYVFGCNHEPASSKLVLAGHELKCPYTPCFCPFPGCDFTHSSKNLYDHFNTTHMAASLYAKKFKFGTKFYLNSSRVGTTFLQEEKQGVMFVFDHRVDQGTKDRVLDVQCIGPPLAFDCAFIFNLEAKCMRISTKVTTCNPKITTKWDPITPSNEFLLIIPLLQGDFQTPFNLLIQNVHPIQVV